MRRVLFVVSAVVVGVVVGLLVTGGGAKRHVAAPPSPPKPTAVSVRPQSVLAQNHAYVVQMFAGQRAWPLGYQTLSNTGTLAKFDNLVQLLESGVQSWLVVHLVFRLRCTREWCLEQRTRRSPSASCPNRAYVKWWTCRCRRRQHSGC